MEAAAAAAAVIANSGSNNTARRLVIYAGPPKTNSASLQMFLSKYANSNSKSRVSAFDGWNYPLLLNRKNGLQFLGDSLDHPDTVKIRKELQKQQHQTEQQQQQQQQQPQHLVMASERLIHYYNRKNNWKGKIFQLLSEWSNVSRPEVVIHYRSPRTDHLIAAWKQYTQTKDEGTESWYHYSLEQYLCSSVHEEVLARVTNPIGFAYDMVTTYQFPTHVIDMKGASKQHADVSHAFACSVLNVDCTPDGKVKGVSTTGNPKKHHTTTLSQTMVLNSLNTNVTMEQLEQIERLFHQRDCAYANDLKNHSLFHMLYPEDDAWPNDCASVIAMPAYRQDASVMFEDIRHILKCPGGYYDQDPLKRAAMQIARILAAFAVVILFVARRRRRISAGNRITLPLSSRWNKKRRGPKSKV